MHRCIELKRESGELTGEQWRSILEAFMHDGVDDAQMAALCMACVLRGMSLEEAHALTSAMIESGVRLTFDRTRGSVVDKHSSGGVSGIVSLTAVPGKDRGCVPGFAAAFEIGTRAIGAPPLIYEVIRDERSTSDTK